MKTLHTRPGFINMCNIIKELGFNKMHLNLSDDTLCQKYGSSYTPLTAKALRLAIVHISQ